MTKHLVFAGLIVVFLTSCNSYRRQVRPLSPHCQALLKEMKYRIIKNDTGGYTFRFEHPVSDTIPKSETPRAMEFINFSTHVLNDSLCQCGLNYDLITHTIGKPTKKYIYDEHDNFIAVYILDFGFNCGGNKCPGSSDNYCTSYGFIFNIGDKLIKCLGSIVTFDIEPYYCSSKALEYILRKERKGKERKKGSDL